MLKRVLVITLFAAILIGCNIQRTSQEFAKVDADSLIVNIDSFIDTNVEIEAVVVHICGVNGGKMKLKTGNGEIIKVMPMDSIGHFEKSLYNKIVKVWGVVKKSFVDKDFIDKLEMNKALLCHIDNMPCKDTAWVNRKINSGMSDSLSIRDIARLRKKMEQTQKEYVSVVTILTEQYEVVE